MRGLASAKRGHDSKMSSFSEMLMGFMMKMMRKNKMSITFVRDDIERMINICVYKAAREASCLNSPTQ